MLSLMLQLNGVNRPYFDRLDNGTSKQLYNCSLNTQKMLYNHHKKYYLGNYTFFYRYYTLIFPCRRQMVWTGRLPLFGHVVGRVASMNTRNYNAPEEVLGAQVHL